MILFDDHNTLYEQIHGGKYYTLCRSFDGRELADYVCLRKIPTKAEAKIILNTLHFPNTKLMAWEGMERIKFANEKRLSNSSNVFGFLWFDKNGVEHNRNVKAKDIDSACKKFLADLPKTIVTVDYEVSFGDEYINISKRKEFKEWL